MNTSAMLQKMTEADLPVVALAVTGETDSNPAHVFVKVGDSYVRVHCRVVPTSDQLSAISLIVLEDQQ